jgi:hypothetical protein
MGEIVFGALTAGLPAAVLLVTLDIPNRKFRYQLKWVFVSLLLANLAGIAAARLLSYSGVLACIIREGTKHRGVDAA